MIYTRPICNDANWFPKLNLQFFLLHSFHPFFIAGMPRATRLCKGDFLTVPVWEDRIINDCFEGEDSDEQLYIIAEVLK